MMLTYKKRRRQRHPSFQVLVNVVKYQMRRIVTKIFCLRNKRSYSISNMKKMGAYQQEPKSPSTIPDKYFKDVTKIRMMNKIKIPKTGDIVGSREIRASKNFSGAVDETSRTEDFMRKLNYSFDQSKLQKNKIQLRALNEQQTEDGNIEKPPSRPPVFERLTAGLLKNTNGKSNKRDLIKNLEESKEGQKIKKVYPVGNFGDTGSSFDKVVEKGIYEPNPYDPEYSNPVLKSKSKAKNLQNRSYIFEKNKISLNMSNIKKMNEKSDVVARYDIKTQVGKNNNKNKKVNQDASICQKISNYWVFGVMDGHGLYGHHASTFAKRFLPKSIFKKSKKMHLTTSVSAKKEMEFSELTHKDIISGFKTVHKYFEEMKCTFDPAFSGTTVNLVFVDSQQKKLVCANAGDSRAVLYSLKGSESSGQADDVNFGGMDDDDLELADDNFEITQLSEDHKPDLPKEKERIVK